MLSDLKFAFRQLAKAPGFTAVVVLSIGLGIAANATVLCWLRGLVLHPLPGVARPEQIALLVSNQGGGCVSLPDLRDFAQQRAVFAGAEASMPTSACLTVDRAPEWIEAEVVTAGFFDVLGVKPILGRTFLPAEDQTPGGNPVLVISENLWRRRFAGDPAVIGRVVDLNRHAFTIIGVVPAAFHGSLSPAAYDAWAPASMIWEVRNQNTYFLTARDARGWLDLVRLQPGVTLAQARAAVAATGAQLARNFPATNSRAQHRLVPLAECPWGTQTLMGPALRLLLAVSLGVLLVVMANVSNLLLARATSRQKEIAIRLAAGASRARLVRQFLTESLLLAVLGGGLGILLASWAVDAVTLFLPAELAATAQLHFSLDGATLALTAVLTLASGLIFGLVPALQASRPDPYLVLKEGGRSSRGGATHHQWRGILVVAEVAIALVLLIGAGLCVQGLQRAQRIATGFRPDHVLLARLQIGMNGYTRETGPGFYRQARQRIAALPGVEEAAWASWFPLGLAGCKGTGVAVEGFTPPPGGDLTYEYAILSPRYFAALRIPLMAGRDFTDRDDATVPAVAIVNEAFARRFWPGQEVLGRRFRSGGTWRTIVGVVPTGKYNRLEEAAWPFFYLPYQQGVPDLDLDLCVRSTGDPSAMAGTLRQAVHDLDPGVGLRQVMPLASYSGLVLLPQRMASSLLLLLGGIALVLAAMGVYAVMAYAVSQRTQEFGVRMALGAQPGRVLWQVMRQGLALTGLGVAAGGVAALGVTHLLASFLYGVSPVDLPTFAGVALLLAVIALLACWLPARRATKVDPIVALRAE
jgi:putative ABC transport system permease protein